MVLFVHFFAVAIYGTMRIISLPLDPFHALKSPREGPVLHNLLDTFLFILFLVLSMPYNIVKSTLVLFLACKVIFPLIHKEFMSF